MIKKLRPYRKTIAAVLGATATWALATFPGNGTVAAVVGLVAAVGTVLGVYAVKNG